MIFTGVLAVLGTAAYQGIEEGLSIVLPPFQMQQAQVNHSEALRVELDKIDAEYKKASDASWREYDVKTADMGRVCRSNFKTAIDKHEEGFNKLLQDLKEVFETFGVDSEEGQKAEEETYRAVEALDKALVASKEWHRKAYLDGLDSLCRQYAEVENNLWAERCIRIKQLQAK